MFFTSSENALRCTRMSCYSTKAKYIRFTILKEKHFEMLEPIDFFSFFIKKMTSAISQLSVYFLIKLLSTE